MLHLTSRCLVWRLPQSHCGFRAPWTYIVAFKSYSTRKRWYANAAEVDLELHKRGIRTKSGVSPFRYFDGATMVSYQVPPKGMETVFCRRQPTPEACLDSDYRFNPFTPNVPMTSFEVKQSRVGNRAGRGVFTKVDIPKGTYMGAEAAVNLVVFMPSTVAMIEALEAANITEALEPIDYYMSGYGFTSRRFVSFLDFFFKRTSAWSDSHCLLLPVALRRAPLKLL